MRPEPLPPGTLLNERFTLEHTLGRGGFSIVYLASDSIRRDRVVVKELAPEDSNRSDLGVLTLGHEGAYLRERFLEEARIISRLNIQGVLPIRAVFPENGTAYYVSEYLPSAETLETRINREGPVPVGTAQDIFEQLMEILEQVHAKGILHRDIKPSNILVSVDGTVTLIDFGSAREWHADSSNTQTLLYTPGYAPPEQLSETGRRSPATDVYGLCATMFMMLAGQAPPPATDRTAGTLLPSLSRIRPDLGHSLIEAIEEGLSLKLDDRPQTIAELRTLAEGAGDGSLEESLIALDEKLYQARRFKMDRRACPSCSSPLVEPKPLKKGVCPVCRRGLIRSRDLNERLCPVCQAGTLIAKDNLGPLTICPQCGKGLLVVRRLGVLSRSTVSTCRSCEETFTHEGNWMIDSSGQRRTYREWREASRRSTKVWICDGCEAQLDEHADGRLTQVVPQPKGRFKSLYPDEWARVAAGLDPGAGNAACDHCSAEYYADSSSLTLIGYDTDPYHFGEWYEGRRLTLDSIRWLAAGKESPEPGLVCENCMTELDRSGDYFRMVKSSDRRLAKCVGMVRKLEDWHRIARGLPQIAEEEDAERQIEETLEQGYLVGEIGFDGDASLLYRGPSVREDDNAAGNLVISTGEIVFGGLLRKQRIPMNTLLGARNEGDILILRRTGEREESGFEIAPTDLVAHLKSGDRTLRIDASLICRRIQTLISI